MLLTRPRTFVLSMSILGILGLISTLQSSRHTLLGQVLSTCGDGICSEAERTEIVLERDQRFGSAAANIGDIDGDQIDDIAVIAPSKTGTANWKDQNSIWILFMNADRTVRSVHKILRTDSELTQAVGIHDGFFHSIAPLGDLNGDGVPDIAVNVGGKLLILMLGNDGSVSSYQHITAVNGAPLNVTSLAHAGDIDRDGVPDLIAGYTAALGGESYVTILFLRQNGTVKNAKVITPADVEIAGL
ncbi:MAG: VCBS repeat-containing protein, partial [Candidatus Peribacteraceae bacterium]